MLGRSFLGLAGVLFLFACNGAERDPWDERSDSAKRDDAGVDRLASARIQPKSGSTVSGDATLTEKDGGVSFILRISGAPPGVHAVHLHENGDCSAPDASSAGHHWNPTGKSHGKRDGGGEFHSGDVGNMDVRPDGTGTLTIVIKDWSLASGASANDPVGKAIVIHAKPDDFVTQPDGAGGDKIGCGVIQSGG